MATSASLRSASVLPVGPTDRLDVHSQSGGLSCPTAVLKELFQQYGDVVRYSTRINTFYLLSNPADVGRILHSDNYVRSPLVRTILGEGLLAADGPHWERQRRLMLPEFKPQHIEKMVSVFAKVAQERLSEWTHGAGPAKRVNLGREMDRIALRNVSRALFGAELDDRFLDAFGLIMRQLGAVGNSAAFGYPLLCGARDNRLFRDAMRVMEDDVQRIIATGDDAPGGHPNLLSLLRGARTGPNARLSARHVRDEVVTMITAGHETTAVTLCWAWYSILSHPHVAARFYREIDEVLGNRSIAAADLSRLSYTRMIIDETLRLYPPVWLVARTALRDDPAGRFPIPAKAGVLISPFLIHRRAEHWPDPEKFEPERFAADSEAYPTRTYIPFLAGRHLCLGKYFALTEAIVVLATIAQRCRLELCERQPASFEPLISLRMGGELLVNVQERCAQ